MKKSCVKQQGDMKLKPLWTLAVLLLLLQLILDYGFYTNLDFSSGENIAIFIADLISSLITILLFALPIGLLIALIPHKQKTFREKIKFTLPASISLVLIILIVLFGYKMYLKKVKSIELRPMKSNILHINKKLIIFVKNPNHDYRN